MPIYEYRCQDCGELFEIFYRSASAKSAPVCPSCQSSQLEKIFSTPSLVASKSPSFRGSTCCGRQERCDSPPCSDGSACRRD